MPFLDSKINLVPVKWVVRIYEKICRKEKESDYIQKRPPQDVEKASVSASFRQLVAASVTVEAVICVPLFLYASVCLIWLLELRTLQLTVRCALQTAGKALAVELSEVPVLVPSVLETEIEEIIGKERLDKSLLADGVHCEKSYIWGNTGIMELTAEYEVKLPFPQFVISNLVYQEEMRIKTWNGYVRGGKTDLELETVVYITETGVVYHKDYNCSYLNLSIKTVSKEQIEELRNKDGGKYYACELCGGTMGNDVYITDYGNRYHSSLKCSGMKRKIYAVPLSEVKGKGVCSKCGD